MYRASFNRISASIALILATFLCAGFGTATQAKDPISPKDIPIEAFAQLPAISSPKLSPDGTTIVYLGSYQGGTSIQIAPLNGQNGIIVPPPEDMEFTDVQWGNNTVLLIQVGMFNSKWQAVYKYRSISASYDIATRKYLWLGSPDHMTGSARMRYGIMFGSQHERIVDVLPKEPNTILMQLDHDGDAYPEVFKVDITKGKRWFARNEKEGVLDWYSDQDSEIRLGVGYDTSDNPYVTFLDANGNWQNLEHASWSSKFHFAGFTKDKSQLFVSGLTGHGTLALYRIDAASGDVIEEVAAHQTVDIDGPVFDPTSRHLAGVAFTDDFRRISYSDPDYAKVQERIDFKKRGHVNTIIDKARDSDRYLFEMHSDTAPSIYYLYDAGTDRVKRIGIAYEGIDIRAMAATKSVSIPVRDGSTIPGYMTIPHGSEPVGLPTIIMPHGGPEARDDAEWDYWAQFYASRGYLVIKPNFRGSTGYGQDFRRQGREQWGGRMQDDITDATKWAIAEGIADPERLCIVGASFGGYAALMGAVTEPGLYKCAISINGVTNLPAMKAKDERYVGGDYWIQFMGLEGTDDKEVSPYHRAEEIDIPVLLMSSKDDARIPYRLSEDMHERLEKLDKVSSYVKLEQGGHGLMSDDARLTMLTESERFLKAHIGGK